MFIKIFTTPFCFNEDLWCTIFINNGIIYALTLFYADISREFWYKLKRIEDIITEHLEEWHDHRCFCCFFGLYTIFDFLNTCGKLFYLVDEVHYSNFAYLNPL